MVLGGLAGLPLADVAGAQQPICPVLGAGAIRATICMPGGALRASRFLADLAIDQHFKGGPPPFERRPEEIVRLFVASEALEELPTLVAALRGLTPLAFTALDTTTGLFQSSVEDATRNIAWEGEIDERRYVVRATVPARLAGGYWRAPDVLHLAFWEGARMHVDVEAGEVRLGATIACVALTSEGLRVVTAGAEPRELVLTYGRCE